MNIEDKNIDKLFQESLTERSFDVPDAFMADLESKLDAPKRKFVWWMWFMPILFTAGVYGGVMLLNSESQTSNPNISLVNNDTLLQEGEVFDANVQSNAIQTIESNTSFNEAGKSQGKENSTLDKEGENVNSDFGVDESGNRSNDEVKFNSEDSFNSKSHSESSSMSEKNNNQDDDKIILENASGSKNLGDYKQNRLDSDDIIDSEDTDEPFNDSKVNTGDLATVIVVDTIKKEIVTYRDSVVVRDSIVIIDSLIVRDSVVIKDSINFIKTNNNGWFSNVYGGFGNSTGKLTAMSNLAQPILDGEDAKAGPELGIEVGKRFGKLGISMGLGYAQYGEVADFSISNFVLEDSVYLATTQVTFIYDTSGFVIDTLFTYDYDTAAVSVISNYEYKQRVSHNRLLIPLRFGYRFELGQGKWSIEPRAALNFEIAIGNRNGRFPIWGSTWLNYTTMNSWSYQLDLSVERKIGNAYLMINPFYRGGVSPIIDNQILFLERKYSSWGGRIGLGINF